MPHGRHLLLANRSGARLQLGDTRGALSDADAAAECGPPSFHTAAIRQVSANFGLSGPNSVSHADQFDNAQLTPPSSPSSRRAWSSCLPSAVLQRFWGLHCIACDVRVFHASSAAPVWLHDLLRPHAAVMAQVEAHAALKDYSAAAEALQRASARDATFTKKEEYKSLERQLGALVRQPVSAH